MATEHDPPLHILFFPFFAPGHLIPVADMAAVFAARGARCTILTTPANADIIRPAVDRANHANLRSNTGPHAIEISLMPFPDVGLPPGVENAMALTAFQEDHRTRFMGAVHLVREPFDRFLADNRPVDAVVSDSFFSWTAHGVPRIVFTGTGMFARCCNESMLRNNPVGNTTAPNPDDDDDDAVLLPGLPHRVELRRSQMMDPRKQPVQWAFYQSNNAADQRSFGEAFNSFRELEPAYVDHFHAALGRRAFLLGPLALAATNDTAAFSPDVDTETFLRTWLDTKPAGSVVYTSFGTVTRFSPAELREIARGLDLSGKSFVWVIGSSAATDDDWSEWMPEGFAELTARGDGSRGFVIRGWAPQTRILSHRSVGGFMTHCGWNSVLEAVAAGVPMVTWPRCADQFYNEKLVVEVLRAGVSVGARDYASSVDAHEVIGGEVIAGSIAKLMGGGEEGEAITEKAKELGATARSAVENGGSSYSDVGRLMDELMARRSSVKVGEDVRPGS